MIVDKKAHSGSDSLISVPIHKEITSIQILQGVYLFMASNSKSANYDKIRLRWTH